VSGTVSRRLFLWSMLLGIGGGAGLIAGASALVSFLSTSEERRHTRGHEFLVGRAAPPVCSRTLEGEHWCVTEQKGKVILLEFWATWCAPCVAHLPLLRKIHHQYGDRDDFLLVSVALDDEASRVERFVKREELTWLQLDETRSGWDGSMARSFHATSIPFTCLIDRTGRVLGANLSISSAQQLIERELSIGDAVKSDAARTD
jgi:thiol-disulfide isomerase/thioredoxin